MKKDDLKVFKNELFEVGAIVEGEDVLFDAETIARSLGFTQTQNKNGRVYMSIRWETINKHLEKYFPNKLGKGDLIPEAMVYKLAFKASNDTAEKFQDWLAIEVIPSIRKTGQYQVKGSRKEEFDLQLLGAEYAMKLLRVDETSKIKMLEEVHKNHGVATNHLPKYVNEEITKALTVLLKENNIGITAAKANTKLIELGILEIKERAGNNGEIKEFKSLTDKGLKYGKNLINPKSPKETQPHYYQSTFKELIELLEI